MPTFQNTSAFISRLNARYSSRCSTSSPGGPLVYHMRFKIEAAAQKMASIQGPTFAILLFGFSFWNGSSTASPADTAGSGLSSPVTRLPSDLPTTHWHTTARPWLALNVPASSYLTRANNLTAWWSQNTNSSDGCLNEKTYNPYGMGG